MLDDEGVVWAIGDARYGLNLKDATYFKTWTPLEFPEPVVGIPGAGCGLLEGGRLYCTSGLWLVDYDMDVDFPLQPKEVEWDEPVVSWATSSIGCVLGASGRLLCRGDNYYSALGWKYPELGQRTTYDVIPGLPPVKSFKLADTATNACALGFDGRLFCWGDNGVGLKIVDDPALKDQAIYPATEVSQELGEIVDYAITDDSLCVLRKDDPEIYCRGFSGTGNCGIQRGWRKVSYEPCDSSAL